MVSISSTARGVPPSIRCITKVYHPTGRPKLSLFCCLETSLKPRRSNRSWICPAGLSLKSRPLASRSESSPSLPLEADKISTPPGQSMSRIWEAHSNRSWSPMCIRVAMVTIPSNCRFRIGQSGERGKDSLKRRPTSSGWHSRALESIPEDASMAVTSKPWACRKAESRPEPQPISNMRPFSGRCRSRTPWVSAMSADSYRTASSFAFSS